MLKSGISSRISCMPIEQFPVPRRFLAEPIGRDAECPRPAPGQMRDTKCRIVRQAVPARRLDARMAGEQDVVIIDHGGIEDLELAHRRRELDEFLLAMLARMVIARLEPRNRQPVNLAQLVAHLTIVRASEADPTESLKAETIRRSAENTLRPGGISPLRTHRLQPRTPAARVVPRARSHARDPRLLGDRRLRGTRPTAPRDRRLRD